MTLHDDPPAEEPVKKQAIDYEFSREFLPILEQLSVTLLVSTYQAGKLVVIGVDHGELVLSFHHFEQAMGIAVSPQRIALGSHSTTWILRSAPHISPQLDPAGRYDGCYLTRYAYVSGEIHGHEMAWVGDDLWIVNTRFSCLCTLNDSFSFAPRWRPPFISSLVPEDRCHLNGMALVDGKPHFVTFMAETDTPHGWRADKVNTGCVMEISTGGIIARGLAMPHSPRFHQGTLFVLDSGHGRLSVVERQTSRVSIVSTLPGYTRGLALHGPYAFVGLSKIRETSTFGGMPIAQRREELKCGVGIVHLPTGKLVAHFEFITGVEEIFDVQLLPNMRCAAFQGPVALQDERPAIWNIPLSGKEPAARPAAPIEPSRAPWKRSAP